MTSDPATKVLVCSFCGRPHTAVSRLFLGTGVDANAALHEGQICSECIGLFMTLMAGADREAFEKMVEEARAFKFPEDEPEISD